MRGRCLAQTTTTTPAATAAEEPKEDNSGKLGLLGLLGLAGLAGLIPKKKRAMTARHSLPDLWKRHQPLIRHPPGAPPL